MLDTEGLYSTDQKNDIDSKIFMLSVLLSSVFIFNQRGHITEQSFEDLALILNLSKLVSGGDQKEASSFFPQLMWVLWDFTLNLGSKTSNEYLEQCL